MAVPSNLAELYNPTGVAVDGEGNVYIADSGNARVRKVALDGTISTVAGTGVFGSGGGNGGLATSTALGTIFGVAVDKGGALYVADQMFLLKVAPDGTISTIAGNGEPGYSGDGGLAISAQVEVDSIAIDSAGTLYFADHYNAVIRRIGLDGIITTVAGRGSSAGLNFPWSRSKRFCWQHLHCRYGRDSQSGRKRKNVHHSWYAKLLRLPG